MATIASCGICITIGVHRFTPENKNFQTLNLKVRGAWGTWAAQLVKCPTLDLGSGRDLSVRELTVQSLLGILSLLSLCLSPTHALSLSLKINK